MKYNFKELKEIAKSKMSLKRFTHTLGVVEMAEKLAMSANGYAKIERGQTKLTFDKLNQIAQIFKIDVVELITKEKPLFLLVGDNSHNYGSNYYGNNEALIAENEKLKLTISHNNEIIQRQENEILALKEIISLLKKN